MARIRSLLLSISLTLAVVAFDGLPVAIQLGPHHDT